MNEQELREQIIKSFVSAYERGGQAWRTDYFSPDEVDFSEEAKELLSLMLKAVEGTRLTDEQISQAKADYANGTMDAGYKAEHFKQKNWGEAAILTAQLEAVKKVFGGVK